MKLAIPGHMSVQEARLHTAQELSRQTEDKLVAAERAGREAAETRYRDRLARADVYCERLRDLVLRAQLALPTHAKQSYDLLKQALELHAGD